MPTIARSESPEPEVSEESRTFHVGGRALEAERARSRLLYCRNRRIRALDL
jgi:hypothetical protein